MDLLQEFLTDLERLGCLPYLAYQRVVVAVSGGADSLCLLHLLRRAADTLNLEIVVATLDHGLRGAAGAADAAFVADLARHWGLPVEAGHSDVPALAREHSLSGEEAARRARYSFLAQAAIRHAARAVVVAHHADDQAETVLLHLIRGSGLGGLRGMQPVAPLTQRHLLPGEDAPPGVVIVRPLLAQPRAAIDAYCSEHGLTPRHDTTNDERTYTRNRIRHEVLPLLAQLNPAIRASLVRASLLISDDYTQLENLAAQALQPLIQQQDEGRIGLDLAGFRRVDASLQRRMLRQILHTLNPAADEPGYRTLDAALELVHSGASGRQITLPGAVTLTVSYRTLTLARPGAATLLPAGPWLPPGTRLAVTIPGEVSPPGSDWRLVTRWLAPEEEAAIFFGQPLTAVLALPADARLQLRTRQPGDRFAPLGMNGRTTKLKDVLIKAHIPAAERATLPLLTINDTVAWIIAPDHSQIADPYAIRPATICRALFRWLQETTQP